MRSEAPYRGSIPRKPPADPPIASFCEMVMVKGTTRKASIPEECVNFLMSAVDVTMTIERDTNNTGDRVAIDLPGRLLSNEYCDNEESVHDYAFHEP